MIVSRLSVHANDGVHCHRLESIGQDPHQLATHNQQRTKKNVYFHQKYLVSSPGRTSKFISGKQIDRTIKP